MEVQIATLAVEETDDTPSKTAPTEKSGLSQIINISDHSNLTKLLLVTA